MNFSKYLKECNQVYHTTLDPKTPGVVRIHLVPPQKPKPHIPWVAIINGYSVLPLQSAWAILLKEFIEELNKTEGKTALSDEDINEIVENTIDNVKTVFDKTSRTVIKDDLKDLVTTLKDLARGKEPTSEIGYMTLAKYSKYMQAPHRMDLMVSAMEKDGCWNCNCKCLHCYAAGEEKSNVSELSTDEWKKAIDALRKACIPAITFTGGEATIRDDLVELIDYSKWFVTRLNTNGILLSKELCERLYNASLDSVQVTLYSSNPEIHNTLVGGNHFHQTVQGIKNAIEAGLDVSINTPLCSLNSDYIDTMKFASKLGVTYFSTSGLIPTGNANKSDSIITQLSKEEITKIIKEAAKYAKEEQLEISFTSPGWISDDVLKKLNIVTPSCGACMSNMAIAPNGDVIPCQSWLNGKTLGNILHDNWKIIWNSKETKAIRKLACEKTEVCLLKEEN